MLILCGIMLSLNGEKTSFWLRIQTETVFSLLYRVQMQPDTRQLDGPKLLKYCCPVTTREYITGVKISWIAFGSNTLT